MAERIRVVKAVLDVQIFLRSLIRKGNVSDKILNHWKADVFLLVMSGKIIDEIDDVLKRPWLMEKYGYDLEEVDTLIKLLYQKAIIVEPAFSLLKSRDPNDNKFVDCAILGRVNYLVSEDHDLVGDQLLKKQLFEYGVEVVNASEFYQKLEATMKTT